MTVRRNHLRTIGLALVAVLTCVAALRSGSGSAHAAVSLLYFQGQHNGDSVLLEWATATELDTAYFFIERADQESGPYEMLQGIGLVPSEAPPDGLSGAEYQRLDEESVSAAAVYWYVLVEVENTQGYQSRTQPIKVAFEQAQPTNTATPTATTLPTATTTHGTAEPPAASPTATPTGTGVPLSPTATPSGTRKATLRPTTRPNGDAQPVAEATVPAVLIDDQAQGAAQDESDPTLSPEGYAGTTVEAEAIALQSDPNGYPGLQLTLESMTVQPYPAGVGPRDLTDGDGTPVPNIGANRAASSAGQVEETATASNSPALGTSFLWLGFLASLMMFVSAVAGAIYFFSRRHYEKY
jgi:hypothetical protein